MIKPTKMRQPAVLKEKLKISMKYSLKYTGVISFALLVLLFLNSCSDSSSSDDYVGNWYELSDYDGIKRSEAVMFMIDDKAYVGTGYNGKKRLKDVWGYNSEKNEWTEIAEFPGSARNNAVAFGAGGKGYIGLGYDGTSKLKDFYEYDPTTDTWTQIDDFPGSARYDAVAFSIDDKGYVGSGYDDNNLKDFYKYDPATAAWTRITSIEGGKRRDAVAFVIGGKGYVCGGVDNGSYEDDFWAYDPEADDWEKLRKISDSDDDKSYDDDYSSIVGTGKVAFTINDLGYVATGGKSSTGSIVWEYDPIEDLWERKTSFEGSARKSAVGFAIDGVGYIATGNNGSSYYDDLWGFDPDEEQVDND